MQNFYKKNKNWTQMLKVGLWKFTKRPIQLCILGLLCINFFNLSRSYEKNE